MTRVKILLVLLGVLTIAGISNAVLIHQWKLDDTLTWNGTVWTGVADSVAGNPTGELSGYVSTDLVNKTVTNLPGTPLIGSDKAFNFDEPGTGISGVNTNNMTAVPATGNFTILVWMKTTNLHTAQGHLFSNNNAQAGRANLYLLNGALGWFHNGGVSLVDNTADKGSIFDGQWHQVGIARQGNRFDLLRDGEVVATDTSSGSIGQDTWWTIGKMRSYSGDFDGSVAEVTIYNTYIYFAEPIHYWKLDDTLTWNGSVWTGVADSVTGNPTGELWGYVSGDPVNTNVTNQSGMPLYTGDKAFNFVEPTGVSGVATNNTTAVPATGDFTVLVWMKTTNLHTTEGHLFSNNNNQAGRANLSVLNGALRWVHNGGVTLVDATAGKGSIFDGGWHEVGIARQGSRFDLLRDGEVVATGTSSGSIGQDTGWMIGRMRAYSGDFDGSVADVQVYNICLTPLISISNDIQTYSSLVDTRVTMTGTSELHLTSATLPLSGSQINLNSSDSWVFLEHVKPSVVVSTYLGQIQVSGAAAVLDSNVRVVEYVMGTVVIPHSPSYLPLQVFDGSNYTGSSMQPAIYTYYNDTNLGAMNNTISSFKLKKGYMATFAQESNGTGISKVYIAKDGDVNIGVLPGNLENSISFVRVFPWRWVNKKGWAGGADAVALDCSWQYDWNNVATSTLDIEYVPMRHNRWWNSYDNINNKQNSTHVLGFNEPDAAGDNYMAVATAIAEWPKFMASGLRVGSPATTDGGLSWLYDFIAQADALNYRVDFVAVHFYKGGWTASQLYDWLLGIHKQTGRPLWVTEFNNGASWTCCEPTLESNAITIGDFINMMDNAPFVERYSVYNWVGATRELITNGVLNPAGVVYRDNIVPMAYAATLLQDDFETNFDNWTDGGATDWDRATDQKHAGSYSARASDVDNDLISDNLNTTGKSSIAIEFWYRDHGIDNDDDVYLQAYNGSAYNNIFELGNSTEDAWNFYTTTIYNYGADAQYFRSNFRIKFEGTSIDSGENLWIDDVKITVR